MAEQAGPARFSAERARRGVDLFPVSKREPCAVPGCGATDGCARLVSGALLCFRVESDHLTGGGWLHWPDGHPGDRDWRDNLYQPPPVPAPPPEPTAADVDPDILDGNLRALLRLCPLSAEHRADLHRRGLTDAEIGADPFGSLPEDGPDRDRIAAALVAERGDVAYGATPGLYRRDGRPALYGYGGLLTGMTDAAGRLRGFQPRPDDDAVRARGKYRWLSSPVKDGGLASGAPCGVAYPAGWIPGTPTPRVLACEGALKARIVANRTGVPVVCFPGVTILGEVPRLVAELGAEVAILALDNDRATKPAVAAADRHLAESLVAAGLAVRVATWPTRFNGLDDALAAGVMPLVEPHPQASPDLSSCSALVAAKEREIAGLRERLAEVTRLNRGFVGVVNTPHLTAGEKVVACRAVLEMKREAARGQADGDRVRLSPLRVALDFRKGKGEATNPGTGSLPIMSKSSAISALQRFEERGVLDVQTRRRPTRVVKTNPDTGRAYAKEVTVDEKWIAYTDPAAALDAFARWRPEAPKERKPYTRQPSCPHCGSTHLRTTCVDCGCIVADRGAPTATPPAERSREKFSTPIADGGGESSPRYVDTEEIFSSPIPEEPAWLAAAPAPDDVVFASDPPLAAARPHVAAADHAPDRAARRQANDDLFAHLATKAAASGRPSFPKPRPETALPTDDRDYWRMT